MNKPENAWGALASSDRKTDPVRNHFDNLVKEENEKNPGKGGENRPFTPAEWLDRFYQGQADEELPPEIFKDVSAEELAKLKEQYASRRKSQAPGAEQPEIF